MNIRVIALVLALTLLAVPALAESRQTVIEVESTPVSITEMKYENAAVGFSFWYDPAVFTVLWDTLDDPQGQLMIHGQEEEGAPVFLTVELPEKTGLSGDDYLAQRPAQDGVPAASLSETQIYMTEGGAALHVRTGYDSEMYFEYYLIRSGSKELQLYTSYSLNAIQSAGPRIAHLVSTFDVR
ncbi:MAG: hypothetical protein IJ662_04810 [Clostridia bacterium]|nr:hypothetical protein [Clostridia bacterium]